MTTTPPPSAGTLRSIAVAVSDTAAAERLLGTVTDLPVTVRDGERWTALDAGGLTLALTVAEEIPGGAHVCLNVKVDDVPTAYAALLAAGGKPAQPPVRTAHEERAAVLLGNAVALVVYRSLPRPS